MRPVAHSDGYDVPWLVDELVPSVAAVIDDVVVGVEDAVGQPVVAHELPDVFGRIEFEAFWRQGNEGDVGGDGELCGRVPPRLIEQQNGVFARRDNLGDFLKVQVHCLHVAHGHNEARTLAVVGTDRAEDVGRSGALIMRSRWPRSSLGPAARDLVLLADASLVAEPDFQSREADAGLQRDLAKARGEIFLNSSIAPSA